MTLLSKDAALQWLNEHGGGWRTERLDGPVRVIAEARGISRSALATAEAKVESALVTAINELKHVLDP